MHWPSDMENDVDLWVKAPGEGPVGFWNQGGEVFNLLRDDLGAIGDATDENYEVSYSRASRRASISSTSTCTARRRRAGRSRSRWWSA